MTGGKSTIAEGLPSWAHRFRVSGSLWGHIEVPERSNRVCHEKSHNQHSELGCWTSRFIENKLCLDYLFPITTINPQRRLTIYLSSSHPVREVHVRADGCMSSSPKKSAIFCTVYDNSPGGGDEVTGNNTVQCEAANFSSVSDYVHPSSWSWKISNSWIVLKKGNVWFIGACGIGWFVPDS